jgi:hypothetical protein
MAFQFILDMPRRNVLADGQSNSLTVDYSLEIEKLSTFWDRSPNGIHLARSTATDNNAMATLIPFSLVLNGNRVTWIFDHPPPAVNMTGQPYIFEVSASLLFSASQSS